MSISYEIQTYLNRGSVFYWFRNRDVNKQDIFNGALRETERTIVIYEAYL